MEKPRLSHLDSNGRAAMVDVAAKPSTMREARARAKVRMSPATAAAIVEGEIVKGDVTCVARVAGISAAKRTADLVPLAHPIPLTYVDVQLAVDQSGGMVEISSTVKCCGKTGVEMEALVAASAAALTVYDMVKGVERGVVIEQVALLHKTGGKEEWRREGEEG